MLWGQRKLAYLAIQEDTPPQPVISGCTCDRDPGTLKVSFFELHNPDSWAEMVADLDPAEALREGIRSGDVTLAKLIKSPSGIMRLRLYQGCFVSEDTSPDVVGDQPRTMTIEYSSATITNPETPYEDRHA